MLATILSSFIKTTGKAGSWFSARVKNVIRGMVAPAHTEKILQGQVRLYQMLIDTISMPVFYKDLSGSYRDCNKAFEEFVGLPKATIIGKTAHDIAPQELADEYCRKEAEFFAHPGVQTYRSLMQHADGTRHAVIFEIAPHTDEGGGTIGLIGTVQDVTESRGEEQIIKRHNDTQAVINWILNISLKDISLDNILQQTLDLILSIPWLSFGSKGLISLVEGNPHKLVMKAQRGLSARLMEECRLVSFGTCLCGRAAARKEVIFVGTLDDHHDIRYEGMVPHGHYCVPIMHAREVVGVINIYLKAGHPKDLKEIEFLNAIASALAGIIKRKKIEAEMLKALNIISRGQKEWQDTFDSITDMIAIIDKNYNIVRANRALSARMGLHPREVINRKCYELLHETGMPTLNCPHARTMREKRPESEDVFNPATKELFRMTTFPYYSPEGELMGSIHIARDITAEKEKEAQLVMSERLAALGQMASGIAHEINNPLASIAGCSEGLLARLRKGHCDSKLFETYLNIIQEEVFRCKSITTSILSFVQKTTYQKKDLNINEMLDKTVEIIGFQGRLKNIEVRKRYAEQPLIIRGSEGELRQVFIAIISNALDAMEEKGVLTLHTGVEGGRVVIRISDTGPGIPADLIPKIFDPFFTTKSDRGGTGLGLSIARKIVLNDGGDIGAFSDPGIGTTFTITFPE
jgi:PAS domain S-box-containing protein